MPRRTYVGRVVPKNAFDTYINTNQKKWFTDYVLRISWLNKLSVETINLKGIDVQEIQLFQIELKIREKIPKVTEIIDKAIPYHIIMIVRYEDEYYLTTSAKHSHTTNEHVAVIDRTFSSDWEYLKDFSYFLNLEKDLDFVHKYFCLQLENRLDFEEQSKENIIEFFAKKSRLEKEVQALENKVKKARQFNRKVELNRELIEARKELESLESTHQPP